MMKSREALLATDGVKGVITHVSQPRYTTSKALACNGDFFNFPDWALPQLRETLNDKTPKGRVIKNVDATAPVLVDWK